MQVAPVAERGAPERCRAARALLARSRAWAPAKSAAPVSACVPPRDSGTRLPAKVRAFAIPGSKQRRPAARRAAHAVAHVTPAVTGALGPHAPPAACARPAKLTFRRAATAGRRRARVATTAPGTVSARAPEKAPAKRARPRPAVVTPAPRRSAKTTAPGARASSSRGTNATTTPARTFSAVVRTSGNFAVPVASGSRVSHVMDPPDV